MIDKLSLIIVSPQIVLLTMACVIAIPDLTVTSRLRTATYWLTMATLAVVAYFCADFAVRGQTLYAFGGMVVSDPMGNWLKCFSTIAMMVCLVYGRPYAGDRGMLRGLDWARMDAEALPFPDRSFDCVTMAFGLRNVTRKENALAEIHRVLKVGGRALVLEFSAVKSDLLKPLYEFHSFQVLPRIGRLVAGDEASYRYLAESIRMHPDQETLAALMKDAGLEDVRFHNLAGGIVALHVGCVY